MIASSEFVPAFLIYNRHQIAIAYCVGLFEYRVLLLLFELSVFLKNEPIQCEQLHVAVEMRVAESTECQRRRQRKREIQLT